MSTDADTNPPPRPVNHYTPRHRRPVRRRSPWGQRAAVIVIATVLLAISLSVLAANAANAANPRCQGWDFFVDGPMPDPDYKWIQAAVAEDQYHRKGFNDGTWWCTMRQGDRNPAVMLLQSALNTCYGGVIGTKLTADGAFGPKTKAALAAAQRHHGITGDGVYGPQTAQVIKWEGMARTPFGMVDACMPLSVFVHQQPH